MDYRLFDLRATQVLRQIQRAGFDSWFVGGCVRDALLGRVLVDYDIATVAKPDDLRNLFKDEYPVDCQAIAFGSIRVNHQGLWLEITTLRRDLRPDGRHTTVEFTTDFAVDAARRDFTINALYWDGQLHSPIIDLWHGQDDLYSQTVRFIDNADARVQEDYLRILRFFRFSAIYGNVVDQLALAACAKQSRGLQSLSGHRVWREWSKMLLQPNTATVLKLIQVMEIDLVLFGAVLNISVLPNYHGSDRLLFTLLLLPSVRVQHLAHRFNLSNAQKGWCDVADALTLGHDFRPSYLQYGEQAKELVYYWAAKFNLVAEVELAKPFWQVLNPTFPITGKDLLNLGCLPGPIVGSYLKRTQNWWVQNNFTPNKMECLQYANSLFNP